MSDSSLVYIIRYDEETNSFFATAAHEPQIQTYGPSPQDALEELMGILGALSEWGGES